MVILFSDREKCESTKTRNGKNGPTRFPDYMWFLMGKIFKYRYELLFVEVLYGPRAAGTNVIDHINED